MAERNRPSMAGEGRYRCRTIVQVRDEFNERHGTNLSRGRIWQILKEAEQKMADELAKDPYVRELIAERSAA